MTSTSVKHGQPVEGKKATGWLPKVFALDPAGINWPRAVLFFDLALVPVVVLWTIGNEQYVLSAVFGLLFSALADPGGSYAHRALYITIFGVIGAALTWLGFGIGADAWVWLTIAAFAVTLVAGLAAMFGVRRFVTALLLNIWFVIALGVAVSFHQSPGITSHSWAQTLAWAGGVALWIAVTFLGWLIHGRRDRPQVIAELPGDTTRQKLTAPMIMFAVIRAVAIGGTIALAFGLDLPHGYWMPIAAIVAMKPSLEQSTLVATQRLAGALIGAVAAALLLLIPAGAHGPTLSAVEHVLMVIALVVLMHGAAIRFWNYAWYCAAIAAGVLILLDLPQPSDYSAEGYRVLWTVCGAGIGVLVMLLAGLLAKLGAGARRAAPKPT